MMSIILQLLVVAMVVTGMAWAIVRDRQIMIVRRGQDVEATNSTRLPWAAYGMLAVCAWLLLASAEMALFAWGWIDEPGGGAIAAIGTLLGAIGLFVFLYGLLDKYLIHRGRPAEAAPRVRAMMSAFVAGWILLPLLGLLVPALQQQQYAEAVSTTRVVDRHGQYSIEVPSSWRENVPLRTQGYAIAMSDVVHGFHVAVLVEDKTDFVQPELHTYAAIWATLFPRLLEAPEMSPWIDTQVNGLPAVQCEAHGVSGGIQLAYMLTCIETSGHFCAIQAWTTRSEFERNRAELERITRTFRSEAKED